MDEFIKAFNENCEKDRQLMSTMMSNLSQDFTSAIDKLVSAHQLQVEILRASDEE